jgi:hypothetical protein
MPLDASSGSEKATCLGRSCLKWGADGELSAIDMQSILLRLSNVDEQASTLMECPIERQT